MVSSPPPGVPEALWAKVRDGVARLASARRVRILCHYAGDGATSAAVLARALRRAGIAFHISLTTVLDAATLARVREDGPEPLIVADMGSGQPEGLEGLGRFAVVLDHHRP